MRRKSRSKVGRGVAGPIPPAAAKGGTGGEEPRGLDARGADEAGPVPGAGSEADAPSSSRGEARRGYGWTGGRPPADEWRLIFSCRDAAPRDTVLEVARIPRPQNRERKERMNHVVCIAYVPDTETKIKIGADGKSIDEADVKWIVSPYDEYALEGAIKAKEEKGGTVTVVTYGPARADVGLRECLARGADEAVRVASDGLGEADSLGVAMALAGAVKALPCDVLWLGNKGVGTDAQTMVPMLAELLDLPHANLVTKLEWKDGAVVAYREIEGAREVVEMPLPCVIGAQKGLNEPRYASLKGIMAAKKKTIAVKTPAEVGVDPAATTGEKAAVRWTKLELPPARQAVKLIPADDPAKAADELVRLLRDEAKVL